ncbi:MAG TPA: 16S rRNA (cytidine(1402)-2'-O)-methyltransferase [bacterium]|nr:16S rRNA (cytidine(1402)-2'-O)-methyltransferase [bacterium]
MAGKLFIVATPIGNLEDMTLRAIRVLKEADLIAAEDTRLTKKLLAHFDIHTAMTSFFKANENYKASSIISRIEEGANVALVSSAGTPCISDPGYPLLAEAVKRGIEIVPVPGACAAIAALSSGGLPTDRFTFIGFLPDKSGKRKKHLEELSAVEHTLVFYVSKWKAAATLADCLAVLGDRDACAAREMTKVHEEIIRAPLSEICDRYEKKSPKGEIVLIVAGKKRKVKIKVNLSACRHSRMI